MSVETKNGIPAYDVFKNHWMANTSEIRYKSIFKINICMFSTILAVPSSFCSKYSVHTIGTKEDVFYSLLLEVLSFLLEVSFFAYFIPSLKAALLLVLSRCRFFYLAFFFPNPPISLIQSKIKFKSYKLYFSSVI